MGLRVGVKGGGCSGFQYALALDEKRDDDHVFDDLRHPGARRPGEPAVRRRLHRRLHRDLHGLRASRSRTRTSWPRAAAAPPSAWRRKSRAAARPSDRGPRPRLGRLRQRARPRRAADARRRRDAPRRSGPLRDGGPPEPGRLARAPRPRRPDDHRSPRGGRALERGRRRRARRRSRRSTSRSTGLPTTPSSGTTGCTARSSARRCTTRRSWSASPSGSSRCWTRSSRRLPAACCSTAWAAGPHRHGGDRGAHGCARRDRTRSPDDYARGAERAHTHDPVLEQYLAERGTSARELVLQLAASLDYQRPALRERLLV